MLLESQHWPTVAAFSCIQKENHLNGHVSRIPTYSKDKEASPEQRLLRATPGLTPSVLSSTHKTLLRKHFQFNSTGKSRAKRLKPA